MPTPSANVTPLTGDMLTVFDQTIGCKGALIVPTLIDMTSATILTGEIDFSTLINQQVLDFVSGFYIDNRDGVEDITLVCATTQMRYVIEAGSQTFGQLLLTNPPKITWSTPNVNGVVVPAYFGNIPFIPFSNNSSAGGGSSYRDIAPSDAVLVTCDYLKISVAGNLALKGKDDAAACTPFPVALGEYVPIIGSVYVMSTGTTATGIVAFG